MIRAATAFALAAAFALPAAAQTTGSTRGRTESGKTGIAELGSNKQPIKIDADRLDVFDKEGRAVFTGNVVAVQGDSTMKCSLMTVFYEPGRGGAQAGITGAAAGTAPAPAAGGSGGGLGAAMGGNDSAIRKIGCKGPVTVASKTQVATGDNAEFDRVANKVTLTGNAAISDGPNVTRGERVVYDLNSGRANIEGGRVRALIVPNSQKDNAPGKKPAR